MATTFGEPLTSTTAGAEGRFYLYMAIACAVVAFLGFAPTYWWPLLNGTLKAHPIVHMHGLVFFCWSLYLVCQTWLASTGRMMRHRDIGILGVSLATLMVVLGIVTAINRMHWAASIGQLEAGRAFAIVPIAAITFFGAAFAAAVTNVRRPDWHKRLMLVAAASILDAPIARWFIVLLAPPGPPGPPPVSVDIAPSLLGFLLIVVAMVVDWQRRGRVHLAYVIAGSAFVILKLLQVPISETAAWHAFAAWLMAFGA